MDTKNETNLMKAWFGSTKEFFIKIAILIVACFVYATSLNVFLLPHEILSGGITGIAMILKLLYAVPISLVVLAFNVPLLIYGYKELNKRFVVYTLFAIGILSVCLTITKDFQKFGILKDNILLAALFGGIISGAASGIIYKKAMSLGGLDIIAMVLKNKYNLSMGNVFMGINIVIISIGAYFFGIEKALYTLMSMHAGYTVMDKVQTGFSERKQVIIITDKREQLADEIIVNIKRGVTFFEGEGAYTQKDKGVLFCVVSNSELVKIREILRKIDPKAFLSICNTVEVRGRGFKDIFADE